MRIWLVQIGEQLPLRADIRRMRTALLAQTLVERGHEVVWWASAFEHQRKKMLYDEDGDVSLGDRYRLLALKGCGYSKNISLRRYLDHRLVARRFRLRSRVELKPDIVVASMPDHNLAWEAVSYAREVGVPVVVDVRDLWPDIYMTRVPVCARRAARMLLSREFRVVGELMRGATAITSVSEGYLLWAMNYAGRSRSAADIVCPHGYSAAASVFDADTAQGLVREYPQLLGKKIVLFVGTFGISYELEFLLEAAELPSIACRDDCLFVFVGDGEKGEALRKRAGGREKVLFAGWRSPQEIAALMSMARVGVIPCRSAEHTLPNKMIEYLSAGLPVLSSLEGEMASFIQAERIGLSYEVGDLGGFCSSLSCLLDDDDLLAKLADNARGVFSGRFCADRIYPEYARHLEVIAERGT